jgi:hypothetical protein
VLCVKLGWGGGRMTDLLDTIEQAKEGMGNE